MPRVLSKDVLTITEAKSQLSKLVERVLAGEEVVIGRAGKPVARLVPFEERRAPRTPDALAGRITMAPDFDALPERFDSSVGRS